MNTYPHPIQVFRDENGELDFDRLYNGLIENEKYINTQIQGDLVLFDYNRDCTYDGAWNDYTRICRGLVLDVVNKKLVALPLPKFFNFGDEHRNHGLPIGEPRWKGSSVFEKLDGSCGICYYHESTSWKVNTRGSFESDQAVWATKFLHDNYDIDLLNKGFTYVFEIIYPENKIVVNYGDKKDLVLLAVFSTKTLDEGNSSVVQVISDTLGFSRPIIHGFDKISEVVKYAKTLPKDEEGYVVRFPSGTRVKIKGDEYCRIHKILAHHSPLTVWQWCRDQGFETIDIYKKEIPEEFWDETDSWVRYYEVKFGGLLNSIEYSFLENGFHEMDNKEIGLFLKENDIRYKNWIFNFKKKGVDLGQELDTKERRNLFETFKPKSNILNINK